MRFEGKVALVTGASSGIGEATARRLAVEGARVIVFARRSEMLSALVKEHPETMHAVAGDVTIEADIERAFAEGEQRFGGVDILVNNAGIAEPSLLVDTPPDKWRRTIEVNLNAVYLTTRRALPGMIERKRGAIINIASISGVVGPEKFPGFVSYCASKGALISMTEALAVEVKQHGIRVNAVSPGSVDTTMWADVSGGAPAAMTPDEVAKSVLFLASDESRPMNGQNLNVFTA
jgi:meso-butanediol dehydrogenase / (S,S)-butanediol dehydrogenase / diacetyl reductase